MGIGNAVELRVCRAPVAYAREPRGGRVGIETVRIPAGSYAAERVRYGALESARYEWWLHDDVPGGMVKYSRTYADQDVDGPDPYNWTVVLVASGTGAQSQLGVTY